MKEEIDNILEGFHLNEYDLLEVRKKLLNLFSVSVNEVKLICGHTNGGVDGCSYKHKDVYTCKYLRNCDVCGN